MGFSALLDVIGSMIIGGFLMIILFRMNGTAVQNNYQYSGEQIVQSNIVEIVRLLEYDFRKIGYCLDWQKIPNPALAIIQADSNSITFLTDLVTAGNPYGNGIVDTLKYYLGTTAALSVTPNPNDRLLYRRPNRDPIAGSNLGITQFKLTYYEADGDKITTMPASPPFGIVNIQIDITAENVAAYGNDYTYDKKVFWRQVRLATRNLVLR